MEWQDNIVGEDNIPSVIKLINVGDFVEIISNLENEKSSGGYVTLISSDSPEIDKGENKIYILGLSTDHPNHNSSQDIFWAHQIKKFRIINKVNL